MLKKHCIPLITFVLLLANPVGAQLNDFTMNWVVLNAPPGFQSGVAVVTNQQVTMTSVAGKNVTSLSAPCSISGDFDVQVDFELLNWPTGNGYGLEFEADQFNSPGGELFGIGVQSNPQSGEQYSFLSNRFTGNPPAEFSLPTNDTFGKLRLIRTGSSVQFYIYSEFGTPMFGVPSNTWFPLLSKFSFLGPVISSGAPVTFRLALYPTFTTNGASGVEVSFSNFIVNAGTISCPVPRGLGLPSSSNPVGTTNEPISTANGNYYNQHTDLTIPGRGGPMVFERTYNSRASYSGPLGANWTHSFSIGLSQGVSGSVAIQWGDGHFEIYNAGVLGFTPQPGVFNALTKNTDGSFSLLTKDQRTYSFTSAGKLTSIIDKNGNTTSLAYNVSDSLSSVTAPSGVALVFLYDANNRIVQVTDPIGRTEKFAYSPANDLVQATDTAGGITTYAYDSSHRVTSITLPNGSTLLQNIYDASGRVVAQINGRGFTTTLAYNTPATRQTTITDPLGNKTVHTYDSTMRIVQITDALGKSISFTYDSNNDRTSVTNQNGATANFSYDSQGNVTSIADANGGTSAFSYDAKNDLLTATNPKGNSANFTYDANSNLTKIVDALGNSTGFAYDGYGQLSSKTNANGNATTYAHDGVGNLTQITDPLGQITSLTYDGVSRLTGITDPNGHTATAAYDVLNRLLQTADPLGNKTQFAYDPVGNLLKDTDANGHATSYAYDATNNLTAVTDALGHVTRYAYDANNNRVGFTNAKGNTTSYGYDALNRLAQISDPLSFVTAYGYDPVSNVVATTDAKGQTNQFAYDALNRLLSVSYADGKNITYSYDADGNRLSMTDSHGTTAYAYDALDRLISVTHPGGKVVAYAYDAVGQRKLLTYPDGKAVTYAYDTANRLSQATDWLGRNTAYTHDPAGNLTNTSYPNGATSALSYDAANRLAKIVNSLKNLPPVTLGYTLDGTGNRTAFSIDGIATHYSYDALNELVAAQLGPLRATWSYDPAGNRSQASSPFGPINYTYDAADRLLTAGKTTFAYDANGNQTSKMDHGAKHPVLYNYDAANRLIGATGRDTDSAFAYDGDGNRISQSVGNGTYSYLNDIASPLPVVLQESGPDGNISYAYGLGLISESSAKFNYFYHYDGLGSVVALSDAHGRPAAAYLYDAWGNSLLDIPDNVGTRNKFRFTGEALDPGTQLYYLRARYYDPNSGRFIGHDPASHSVQYPLAANRYSYVLSNPVRYVDPSGMGWFDAVLDFFLAYKRGQPAQSQIPNEIACALSSNCTLSDANVNGTNQTQVQALQELQAAGSQAGEAMSSGANVVGPGPGATAFDIAVFLTNIKQSINDLIGLPGKIIEALTPKANAATVPSNEPTATTQK